MSKVTYTQTSFNGGEISPRLQGRSDFERYKTGLDTCENAIILPQGGVMRRPGFQFIYEVKDSSKPVELIPFEFSEDQAYVLEFGDLYMRVFMDGGIVVTPDSYTVLLLHCDGDDGSITFDDKSPSNHTVTVVANAAVDTAQYKFATGSAIFDGTGDALSIPDHANFNFGAAEFTIDTWFRLDSITRYHTLYSQLDTTTTDLIWLYADPVGQQMVFRVVDTGTEVIDLRGACTLAADTWYHVAVVQTATTIKLYLNGVEIDTAAAVTMPNHDQAVKLGYIEGDTIFRDFSPDAKQYTLFADVTRSATQAKFGETSIKFDGTGDYIQFADHADFDICSTANATTSVSFWVYPTVVVGENPLAHYQDANNWWAFTFNGSQLTFGSVTAGVGRIYAIQRENTSANAWYHVLMQKDTTRYGLWLNGHQVALSDSTTDITLAGLLQIGVGNSDYLTGYMDDVLIEFANRNTLDPGKPLLDSSGAAHGYATKYSYSTSPSAEYTGKWDGCIWTDGVDDVVQYADHADWDIANQILSTVDFWIKLTSHAGNGDMVLQVQDGNNFWRTRHEHAGGLVFELCTGGTYRITMRDIASEITDSDWHHIAIVNAADHWGLYKDGVQYSYAYQATDYAIAGSLDIGGWPGSNWTSGFFDELRITHWNSFNVDPGIWIFNEATDTAGYGTKTSNPIPSTAKWGTSSIYFDGSDDCMTWGADVDYSITEKANATVDFWVKFSDHVGTEGLCQCYVDVNNSWRLEHVHGSGLVIYKRRTLAGSWNTASGGEITDTNWHHIAICKVGNDYGVYKDGVQVIFYTTAVGDADTGTLYLGKTIDGAGGSNWFQGNIDDFRITHTNAFSAAPVVGLTDTITVPTAAHGTTDIKALMHFNYQALTVPTAAHTSDANTKLLMHFNQDSFTIPTVPVQPNSNTKLLVTGQKTTLDGYLDEFRVSKGVARWSAAFTVPTTEYPAAGGSSIYEMVTEYTYSDVADLRVVQSTDTLYIAHPDYNVRVLSRTDHDAWSIAEVVWAGPAWGDINATATTMDSGNTTGSGITLVASASYFTQNMVGAWFKMKNGYGKIATVVDATNATWDIKDDLDDHNATADWYRGLWDKEQGYPSTITFHEDRLVMSGVAEWPLTVFFSETGNYTNMTQAATAADDPFDAMIWSQQQNQIKWLLSGKRLFIGTVGSEFWMSGSTIDTPIAYNSIQAKPESSVGSEGVAPVMIDSTVFFVQDGGERIRLWAYNLSTDSYESNDLSIMADHLTAYNPIYKMQYSQYPYSVLWATTYDGTLLGCTIVKSANVFAWHHHTLGGSGSVESIAVIPGDNGDELWAVVSRTINSATVQYVEKLNDDFFEGDIEDGIFMDSAISWVGTLATSFTGADHLEGETVQVIADGSYIGEKTISTGAFTLDTAATDVHCGFAFDTNIKTLTWNLAQDKGSSETTKKRIVNVMVNLFETCELSFGRDASNLLVYPMDDATLYTQRFSQEFNGDWDYDPTIYFRQSYPFPMTLLSVSADIETGGRA